MSTDKLIDYTGKRVLVTGGASGQGAATVQLARDLGAEVVVCDIRKPDAGGAEFVQVDLGDPGAIAEASATVDGPIDALFNCAGLPMTRPPLDVFRVNFLGLRHFTEALLDRMPEGSAIASISSIAGMGWMQKMAQLAELLAVEDFEEASRWADSRPELLADGYTLAKEAIVYYTMTKGAELAKRRMRINCISPGAVDTPMLPDFVKAAGDAAVASVWSVAGRKSTAEEQAKVLAFLNSDAASYVNGTNVFTDGGFTGAVFTGTVPMPTLPTDA